MTLYYISPNNSKNTNHGHISLTATDHYNFRFPKNFQFEKTFAIFLYFGKSGRQLNCKGLIWEGLRVSLKSSFRQNYQVFNFCGSSLNSLPADFGSVTQIEDYQQQKFWHQHRKIKEPKKRSAQVTGIISACIRDRLLNPTHCYQLLWKLGISNKRFPVVQS